MFRMAAVFCVIGLMAALPQPLLAQGSDPQAQDASSDRSEEARWEALRLDRRAGVLFRSGDSEGALELLAEALRLTREVLGEEDSDTVRSLRAYAAVLKAAGRAEEAEPLFAEALRAAQAIWSDGYPEVIALTNERAAVLLTLGRTNEAETLFSLSQGPHHESLGMGDPDDLFTLNFEAFSLLTQGRAAEAERVLGQALRQSREELGERHPASNKLLNNYAGALLELGRAQEAEPLLAQVLENRRAELGNSHPDTILSLSRYANVLQTLDRAEEAEPLLAEALRLSRDDRATGPDHPQTQISLNQLAGVLVALDRSTEAERIMREALRPYREAPGEANPDTNLDFAIMALLMQGRLEEVEPLEKEALRKVREELGERHPQTLMRLSNYAALISQLGRLEEAEKLLEEALRLRREVLGERHPETLSTLKNYAGVLLELGRPREAEPYMKESARLHREVLGERHFSTIHSLENYALVLAALGRADEAEPLAADALRLSQELESDRELTTLVTKSKYATVLLGTDRPDRAAPIAREIVAAYRNRVVEQLGEGLKGRAQSGRDRAYRRFIERLLADSLWSLPASGGARAPELLEEAFAALQLASAGSTNAAVAEAAAARFGSESGSTALVRERQDLTREWTAVEAAAIGSLESGAGANPARDAMIARLVAIEARLEEIDARLAEQAPQYFAILNQQTVGVAEVRSLLDQDEAILMLVPTDRGTHSMVVNDSAIAWARSDWGEEDLAKKIAALREGLEPTSAGGMPVFDFDLAHAIHAELIAPVEAALAGKQRVYIVADGALSRVPLGALLSAPLGSEPRSSLAQGEADQAAPVRGAVLGGGSQTAGSSNDPRDFNRAQWLADRFALVNLPSLQSLVFIRNFGSAETQLEGGAYLGFGDPVLAGHMQQAAGRGGVRAADLGAIDAATMLARGAQGGAMMDAAALRELASLPGTRRELEQVIDLLGASRANLFLAEEMTEPAIRNADLSQTRILHLATHGLTSEEGGRLGERAEPGLVFTPPEQSSAANDGYLAASEVVGLNLSLAEWVILSACNTAAPSGKRGETGLTGLAQTFFYAGAKSLLVSHWPVLDEIAPTLTAETLRRTRDGMPKAEAFRAAMQEARKLNPHPAAWAPFVLVGEGR